MIKPIFIGFFVQDKYEIDFSLKWVFLPILEHILTFLRRPTTKFLEKVSTVSQHEFLCRDIL